MKQSVSQGFTVTQAFNAQVAAYPDNVALKYLGERLTYRQLNQRALTLAANLVELGVTKGDVVGILMPRSFELYTAMLAILKCGAVYMPLDDGNPATRNQQNLQAANCKLLLHAETLDDTLITGQKTLQVSADYFDYADDSVDLPELNIDITPEDGAYVMFTSGSTSEPKGVLVPHRAVVRLVKNTNYIDISSDDTVFQFAPVSFDASTFEIWGPLLNGGSLAIYSGKMLDPNLFAQELALFDVDILWLTSALFSLFVNRYIDVLKPLKTLLAGGDVLSSKTINKVLDAYPDLVVINGYGPTENTTFTCCHRMAAHNKPGDSVPIGKAITGTNLHILDEFMAPVADGNEGFLYVSGLGVALGYINSKNHSAFFEDATIDKGLIYGTGDIVRRNESGETEFIGRKDHQVKIRGFRVSIEEIQNLISEQSWVEEVAVFLERHDEDENQLVAFIRLTDECTKSSVEIKRELSRLLPQYMVPNRVCINENLPISVNGKIDRAAIKRNLTSQNNLSQIKGG